MFIRIFYIM